MSHCERFFANFLLVLLFSMAVIHVCLLPNGQWAETVADDDVFQVSISML